MNTVGMTLSVNRFKAIVSDPVKFQNFLRTNKKDIFYWITLFIGIGIIYMVFSDGDFSFLLTLSALIQMFGFFLIAMRVRSTRSVSGLSLNTLVCYAFSIFARLISVIWHQGYLPYDSTGDYVYRIGEFLALSLSIYMIYMAGSKYKSTYNWDMDKIHWAYIVPTIFVFSLLIHPGLNSSYFADISWGFSVFLETIAMFPQLYMFSKKGGEIESFTSHFVASQGFARVFGLIFWLFSYHELNNFSGNIWSLFKGYVGYIIMGFQLMQVFLFSDFLYEYIKSLKRGLPMTVQSYIV